MPSYNIFLSSLLVLSLANHVLSEDVLIKETDKIEFRKNEKTTGDEPRDQIDCLNKADDNGKSLCDEYTPDLISCYNYQKSSTFDDFSCFAKLGKSVTFDSTKIECAYPGYDKPLFDRYVKDTCYIEIVLKKQDDGTQTWLNEHNTLILVIFITVIVLAILAAFYNQCIRKRCC